VAARSPVAAAVAAASVPVGAGAAVGRNQSKLLGKGAGRQSGSFFSPES
jgi:hypothetical protein